MQFNPCHANARGVFRTLSNIYDGASPYHFHALQTPTLSAAEYREALD